MSRIKLDSESMKLIALFESMTGSKVKDCIANGKVTFIIEENDMGRAIGKNGANIRRIENSLKKKVRLVEFRSDAVEFVRSLAYPADVSEIKLENNIITIKGRDSGTRAMLIGRDRQNISHMLGIVKRHFDIAEIRVV